MPKPRLRFWGVILVLSYALGAMPLAHAADSLQGANRSTVVDYYGKPTSSMKAGAKEVLIYPDGRVTLVSDQVTQNSVPYPKLEPLVKASPTTKAGNSKPASVSADQMAAHATSVHRANAATTDSDVPSTRNVTQWHWPLGILSTISLLSLIGRAILRHRDRMPPQSRRAAVRKEVMVGSTLGKAALVAEKSSGGLATGLVPRPLATDREMTPPPFPIAPSVIAMGFSPLAVPPPVSVPGPALRLTPALLCELEWRRFEEIVAGYYRTTGARPELTRAGANGGLDLRLYKLGEHRPYAFVQCKAWVDRDIDEPILESTLRIMNADGILTGVVITPRAFTGGATAFAGGKPLELIDGSTFISRFNLLADADQQTILRDATKGDFRTPTCPQCGEKMVQREAPDGREWYCTGFPQCHAKPLKVRTVPASVTPFSRVTAA